MKSMRTSFKFVRHLCLFFTVAMLVQVPILGAAGNEVTMTIQGTNGQIRVTLQGIDALHNGFHYEGWAIINSAPVSTGKFNIGPNNTLVDLAGNAIVGDIFLVAEDLTQVAAIVLTIEPNGDVDTVPFLFIIR